MLLLAIVDCFVRIYFVWYLFAEWLVLVLLSSFLLSCCYFLCVMYFCWRSLDLLRLCLFWILILCFQSVGQSLGSEASALIFSSVINIWLDIFETLYFKFFLHILLRIHYSVLWWRNVHVCNFCFKAHKLTNVVFIYFSFHVAFCLSARTCDVHY